MIWNIIFFIIPVIFLALILWCEKKEHKDNTMVVLTIMCSMWALATFVSLIEHNVPTALDVYRGKTTLEITYRDSIAIDSTVVYKVK
jgi:hypothetical protein